MRTHLSLILLAALTLSAGAESGHQHPQHSHSAGANPPAASSSASSPGFFGDLFKSYVPRRFCMYEERGLIGLHVTADLLIVAAYYSIPVALVYFVRRRRDVAFNWMFLMFAAFILACGTTHVFGVWAIWEPMYRLDAVVKVFTAGISVVTAAVLWPLIPKALALPSPAQLEARVRERTEQLDAANATLETLLGREKAAREEAERVNRAKDEFLATLSHELRTPLNAIFGWAQILRRADAGRRAGRESDPTGVGVGSDSGAAESDLREGLEVIERNARAQTRLIDDLLDMSRIVGGRVRLEVVPDVNLAGIVDDVVRSAQPAAEGKQIEIRAVLNPHAAPVPGDAARLQQVVWNLLTNAIKFTPKGGRVRVTLSRVNSHVELVVADNGEGIDAELLPHVFERFRQGDSSSTRRHGGVGLGLAIVRHLVELHGGTVTAASAGKGGGSTFTVNLPVRAVRPVAEASSAERQASSVEAAGRGADELPSLAGVRVLVVDDDADARELIRRVLAQHGASVAVAASAAEALGLIDGSNGDGGPRVVLSDVGMPDVDGYGLIKALRSRPAERGGALPAVALTAFARAEDRVKSMLAGFQVHLSKPVEPAELVVVVAKLAGVDLKHETRRDRASEVPPP